MITAPRETGSDEVSMTEWEGAYRGDEMRDGYWEDKDTAKMLTGHPNVRLGLPP